MGAVSAGVPASGTLASVFCLAATGNGIVDAAADLPGPGAVSLPGMFVVNERSRNASQNAATGGLAPCGLRRSIAAEKFFLHRPCHAESMIRR